MTVRPTTRLVLALSATAALVVAACDDADSGNDEAADGGGAPAPEAPIVFNGEANNLNAYETEPPFEAQQVITNANDDPQGGLDINAQICFFPDDSGRFVAGEDTDQPDPPPGWGIFELEGDAVGELDATQVGKLTPTYQNAVDNAENYGCGFLSDGRVVTTDIGNQAAGDPNGQLIVWFPPFDSRDVRYCKIDVTIPTAGQIYVDDQDRVYVPSARPPSSAVLRYTGPFPTSDDAEGGCGQHDAGGAPLADAVARETFIAAGNSLITPIGIVASLEGGFFVSSVINGVINEYDEDGQYLRTVLQPPAGEQLGEQTFSTGTPLGLGIDADGTLYYADIGITITSEGIGPGPEGSVRRIRFVDGEPQPPEVMADGLAFPDGIGVLGPPPRN